MKALKKSAAIALVAVMFAGIVGVGAAKPAEAMVNDLDSLIVMNGLFTGFDAQELAGLIAVDEITGVGGVGGVGTSDLESLIILGGLFGGFNDAEEIAGLIAVDNIF